MENFSQFFRFSFFILVFAVSIHDSKPLFAAEDGRNEAVLACKNLFSSSSQNDCLGVVKDTDYFEIPAVQLCSSFFSDTSKVQCLKTIRDKKYLSAELEVCKEKFSDSAKMDCLKVTGKKVAVSVPVIPDQPVGGAGGAFITDEALLRELKSIESKLRDHETSQALIRLGGLIRSIENRLGQKGR